MAYRKYRAVKTVSHGVRFDSRAEAARYEELLDRGDRGEIRNLELQPFFDITSGGMKIARYVADFRYEEWCPGLGNRQWVDVVEDVKGVKTAVYRLKKKLVEAQHGITIIETSARRKAR